MRFLRGVSTCLAGLALLALAACSGGPKTLYTDPDFDARAVDRDGLMVGAVVTAPGLEEVSGTSPDALTVGESLRRSLQERREHDFVGPGQLLLEGDVEGYRSVIEDYRRTGRLSAEDLEFLHSRRSLGRFLLLGRIDLDEIEHTHEETRDDQEDRVRFEIELLTRHHVGLSADVYDLDRQRIVWSSTFDRRLQVRGQRITHEARTDDVDNAPIEEMREIRDRIHEVGYPEAPSREELLRRLFDDLEAALPSSE